MPLLTNHIEHSHILHNKDQLKELENINQNISNVTVNTGNFKFIGDDLRVVNRSVGYDDSTTSGINVNNGSAHGFILNSNAELRVDDRLSRAKLDTINSSVSTLNGKFTSGNDDTLTNASQMLLYGKDYTYNNLHVLQCSTQGKLEVDTNVINSSTLNAKISKGSDATLSEAQQVVVYGRDSGGNLDAINVDQNGHLKIINDSVENKGSEGNILNNQSFNGGTTTTSINISDYNHATIFYEDSDFSSSNSLYIEVSEDNSKFYVLKEIYPMVYATFRNHVETNLNLNGIKYLRFRNPTATPTGDLNNVYITIVGSPN